MNNEVLIDFAKLGGPVYAGRPKGERARVELKIDEIDAQQKPVHVIIPESTYALNSSYFLGLFGPSVISAASREKFFERFRFDAPDFIRKSIDAGVERALIESRPL